MVGGQGLCCGPRLAPKMVGGQGLCCKPRLAPKMVGGKTFKIKNPHKDLLAEEWLSPQTCHFAGRCVNHSKNCQISQDWGSINIPVGCEPPKRRAERSRIVSASVSGHAGCIEEVTNVGKLENYNKNNTKMKRKKDVQNN